MNTQDIWISSLLLVVSIALYVCAIQEHMIGVGYGTPARILAGIGVGSAGHKLWSIFRARKTGI